MAFSSVADTRRNLRLLTRFMILLVVMTAVYGPLFHFLMAAEGQKHSWLTGLYWAVTVMSTLGFGDIARVHRPLPRLATCTGPR